MVEFDPMDNWIWIAAFCLGAIILAIALCIVICLCRRRCAKRRIREALQIQENYLGTEPKTSMNSSNSNIPSAIDTMHNAGPIINMKSVSMHNVAEESDENDDEDEETEKNTASNGQNVKKKRHRMLDLSSDVVENDENINNQNLSQSRKYKKKYAKKSGGGGTPIIGDVQIQQTSTETFSGTAIGPAARFTAHDQQTSFVLDGDIDYYTQIKQMNNNDIIGNTRSRQTSLTNNNNKNTTITIKTNTDILDDEDEDDDDDDVEYDYGSQI